MEMITENSAQENAQTANVTKALQSPEFSDKMAMYCLIMSYLDRLLDDGVLTKEEYERASVDTAQTVKVQVLSKPSISAADSI